MSGGAYVNFLLSLSLDDEKLSAYSCSFLCLQSTYLFCLSEELILQSSAQMNLHLHSLPCPQEGRQLSFITSQLGVTHMPVALFTSTIL